MVTITFLVPADFGGRHAELLGEFLSWAPLPMDRDEYGGFSIVIELEAGRLWCYQFLLDGARLVNDPAADDFVANADGGHVSVLST